MIGATKTSLGVIRHAKHPKHGFFMPVKLRVMTDGTGELMMLKGNPIPRMSGNKYVYALPGGGEYVL